MFFIEKTDCYLDTRTGLEWSLENYEPMSWHEAVNHSWWDQDWRLPTIEELISIIDYTGFDPATELPSMHSSHYWSGSTLAYGPDGAWFVYFNGGNVSGSPKTERYYVRFMRGGQQP